ncbi:MAG: helicase HerA-like domain-containing protein, partial [Pseudomonadota bacterium]
MNGVFLGKGDAPQTLALEYANRHGLIAGATGTGKTVTVQVLAQGFADAGVPVFLADVKGDLAGLSQPGTPSPKLLERAETIGMDAFAPAAATVRFWDLGARDGEPLGHPIRATVTEVGPLLLARLLDLNDVQSGVLTLAFRVADDEGLLLLDLDDLRALLVAVGERAKELSLKYGHVSKASVGAIQRRLLTLEEQGAGAFFGEPALDLDDLMMVDAAGRGVVNILAADRLMRAPAVYAVSLLWLLSELFEALPEVGDPDKPVLAFFFDEAHLLFDDAPDAFLDVVERVVRLIRSKGVAVFFATQNPLDVPDSVSSQLATRVIHGLRAFTPREKRVVKAAAETFRANPAFDAETVLGELGVGEALVSTLEDKGVPSVVERTLIRPPASRMGPVTPAERRAVLDASPLAGIYDEPIDRRSAYELLTERAERRAREPEAPARRKTAKPRARKR